MSTSAPDATPIPDTYTPTTTFGAALVDALGPWMTLHLAWFCDAFGAAADPWWNLIQDVGVDDGTTPTVGTFDQHGALVTTGYQPGYGAALNPTAAAGTELTFLGQFVGVPVPIGADDTTARSLVTAEAGINRATDAAVIAAAKRTLTGTQTVYYYPRTYLDGTNNAGWAGLSVLTSECASFSATQAAVLAVKLGGVLMWFTEVTGWTIGAMEAAEATIGAMEAAFVTVNGMEGDRPGA